MKTFFTLTSLFIFLALPALAETKVPPKQVVYEIPKMMCGGCTGRVTKSISDTQRRGHKGVSDVHVTLMGNTASFTCDVNAGCDEKLIKEDLARIQFPAKEKKILR